MRLRIALAALPPLALAAAALAAPPLAIPIPRPTPDQEALLIAAAEEERLREEAEEARLREEAALAEPEAEPEATETETETETEAPAISEAVPAPVAPAEPEIAPVPAPVVAPVPVVEPVVAPVAAPAPAPTVANVPSDISTNAVFRRDPFWPVAVTRARKADHDARVAAAIEEANRLAALAKIREDAIRRGVDVSGLDDDQIAALAGESALPDNPKTKPKAAEKFAGASDEEWDAALARIPPRSGYLGGKRPALMLKGDKRPHYAGDELCATNRGVVFTWKISSVDFRAYAHELERVSAKPVTPDRNQKP